MSKLLKLISDWILIFAILAGIGGYFLYASVPALDHTHAAALTAVHLLQPILIFGMLFLTFCKVDVKDLRLQGYHWWLLFFQVAIYLTIGGIVMSLPQGGLRIVLEGAMLCFICPTATAGAVIVKKLGGSPANITAYTILINAAVSVLIPLSIPLVHPNPEISTLTASLLIISKVFPLLLYPLLTAIALRRWFPGLHARVERYSGVSFYLWVVALALAMAVTTRSVMHSDVSLATELWLVAVSLLACIIQFAVGRRIGAFHGDYITAGQSLGQKNTVLAIWMGYTFFTPVTALVGGFYSIWHNLINSWQLYTHKSLSRNNISNI